jgi:hypothetical protein
LGNKLPVSLPVSIFASELPNRDDNTGFVCSNGDLRRAHNFSNFYICLGLIVRTNMGVEWVFLSIVDFFVTVLIFFAAS